MHDKDRTVFRMDEPHPEGSASWSSVRFLSVCVCMDFLCPVLVFPQSANTDTYKEEPVPPGHLSRRISRVMGQDS